MDNKLSKMDSKLNTGHLSQIQKLIKVNKNQTNVFGSQYTIMNSGQLKTKKN